MSEHLRCIGYIRTSPTDHHPNVQADALKEAGCAELHEASGDIDPREALKELLDLLGDGDTLIVYRMDRLGRDEHNVENFQRQLEAMGVTLIVSDDQEMTGGNRAD
jgi:DNA invertase Pin-like site-specific DNA recombinase